MIDKLGNHVLVCQQSMKISCSIIITKDKVFDYKLFSASFTNVKNLLFLWILKVKHRKDNKRVSKHLFPNQCSEVNSFTSSLI